MSVEAAKARAVRISQEKRRLEQDHETWLRDVRDAERYRWLRQKLANGVARHETFDMAIDRELDKEMTCKAGAPSP